MLSTIWAALSLIVIATVITGLYREASERSFSRLLAAHLSALNTAVVIDETGRISGEPDLGEQKYLEKLSGWYWSVEPLDASVSKGLYSQSLAGRTVASKDVKIVPFKGEGLLFRRTYTERGLSGETVEIVEAEYEVGRTILLSPLMEKTRARSSPNLS